MASDSRGEGMSGGKVEYAEEAGDREEGFDRDRLYRLAEQKTRTGRRELAETIADLFYAGPGALSDRERALIFDILRRVIHDAELAVRRKLSTNLAELPDAPNDLVMALANDEIEVAYPILTRSRVIEDEQLIEIIQLRANEHRLAIALRDRLPSAVSDALVKTGSESVIVALLRNSTAQISRATLEYLVDQSQRVDAFQEPILRREDLPIDLAKRMYRWVSDALRQYIVANFKLGEADVAELVERSTDQEIAALERNRRDPTSALAKKLDEAGAISSSMLTEALREGEVRLFIALLKQRTGLREVMLMRMLMEPEAEGLAITCKAADLDRDTFEAVLRIMSGGGGLVKRSDETVENALRLHGRVPKDAADEVIQHWRRSSDYRSALRMLGL